MDAQSGKTGVKVSAFKDNTAGTLTVVVINNNPNDVTATFRINNLSITSFSTIYRTSRTENWAPLPAITVSNSTFTATLEGNSVTTFVGK